MLSKPNWRNYRGNSGLGKSFDSSRADLHRLQRVGCGDQRAPKSPRGNAAQAQLAIFSARDRSALSGQPLPSRERNQVIDIQAALVRAILEQWKSYQWTVQGFGFIRTKIADIGRIHVWDSRLA